jgi:AcrR family transcriptional regulator
MPHDPAGVAVTTARWWSMMMQTHPTGRTESVVPQATMWRRDPDKKMAILRAARRLFTERGYADTTVRDIADRAGVNQSLIFRYCGSKHELIERSRWKTSRR